MWKKVHILRVSRNVDFIFQILNWVMEKTRGTDQRAAVAGQRKTLFEILSHVSVCFNFNSLILRLVSGKNLLVHTSQNLVIPLKVSLIFSLQQIEFQIPDLESVGGTG